VHLLLGQCYQEQNEIEKAKSELMSAVAADPSSARPHFFLAQLYRKLDDRVASASEAAKFEELSRAEKEKAQLGNTLGSDK
jgi:Tfp pilus assembly protein PilF